MSRRGVTTAAITVVALAGCGGGDRDHQNASPTSSGASRQERANERCFDAFNNSANTLGRSFFKDQYNPQAPPSVKVEYVAESGACVYSRYIGDYLTQFAGGFTGSTQPAPRGTFPEPSADALPAQVDEDTGKLTR